MLLKLIFTLSIVVALPLELAHAEAPDASLECLSKKNDPNNDFYAKRLNNMVKYIDQAPGRLKALKKRNEVINARLKELNEKIIPNLKTHISKEDDGTMYREVQAADLNYDKAEKKAATERRNNQTISQNDYTAKKTKLNTTIGILKRSLITDQEHYDKTSGILTVKELEIKQIYEQEDAATKEKFNKTRTLLLRGSLSKKNQFQNIDEQEAAQLAVTDKKRQAQLADIQGQKNKLNSTHGRRMAELQQELKTYEKDLEGNEQTYKSRLGRSQTLYNQATTAAKESEATRLGSIEGKLGAALARNTKEVAALEKELNENIKGKPVPQVSSSNNSKTTVDPSLNNPELYLDYHGIEQIEENMGKATGFTSKGEPTFDSSGHFEMVKRWWEEQGRKNRELQTATEAQAITDCKDCKVTYIPPPKYTPEVAKECIVKPIQRLSNDTAQYKCDSNDVSGSPTKNLCITDDVADYTQWSVNNAIKCLSPKRKGEEIDPNIIALKINRESNFNFNYCYGGGCGLVQTTTCARDEMMGCSPSPYCCEKDDVKCKAGAKCNSRSSGRSFIAEQLSENSKKLGNYKYMPNPCEPYKKLINFDNETQANNSEPKRLFEEDSVKRCQSISLEEGMHRNIMNGIGLYLFYRDSGPESATQSLKNQLGLTPENSDYKKIRDYLALGMYGRDGNTGALKAFTNVVPKLQGKMADGNLSFAEFKSTLDAAIPYLSEIKESAGESYGDIGGENPQCTLK